MKITQSQLKSLVRTIVKESVSELTKGKRRRSLKENTSMGGYMVLEADGHNYPLLHKFRDEAQFVEYMTSENSDFSAEDFVDGGDFTDDNGNHWTEFNGQVDYDHTSEK
jgi:hypothetical protein